MLTAIRSRTIEQLEAVMPGQSVDWYQRISRLIDEGAMPMPMIAPTKVVETYRSAPKPPTTAKPAPEPMVATKPAPEPMVTAKPAPEPPPNVASEETKAKLLALCKSPEMAEYYVAAERHWTKSEERAWQRAIDKLTEEEEKAMADKVKLYSNIGFYS